MAACWNCDTDIGEARVVRREETCERCASWVHCCKNCRFWNGVARTCDEPAAEWVHDRERANFCDYFALPARDEGRGASEGGAGEPSQDAREAFERLFRK